MRNPIIFRFNYLFKTYILSSWQILKKSDVPNSRIFILLVSSILGSFLEAFFIMLLPPLINALFNQNQSQINNYDLISKLSITPFFLLSLVIIVLVFKSGITTFSAYYITKVTTSLRKSLRFKLLKEVNNDSWSQNFKSGEILDAYLVSTKQASEMVQVLNEIITNFSYSLAITIVLFLQFSLDLVVLFLLLGSFYYLLIYFLSRKGKELSGLTLKKGQQLSQLVNEFIRGSRELQIYRVEDIILNRLSAVENKILKIEPIIAILKKIPTFLPSIAITIIVIYVYFSNGIKVLNVNTTIVLTSLVAIQRLSNYVSILGLKLTEIGTKDAQVQFVLNKLNKTLSNETKEISISDNFKNCIKIEKLTFHYENNKELLRNLNLNFFSGKVSIIAGPSGSGKSSLFKLILKECYPIEGNIKVNDLPLKDISKESWYSNLSFVSQDPFIFGTTITNNIRIGKIDASIDEIRQASKNSGAFDFINKLPNKFDFNISEGGKNLSGGQCQLLSLTRAILKDVPIVLLDEPSNNLDLKSIAKLKELFLSWANRNKIVIVITHDLRLLDDRFDIYNVEKFKLNKKDNLKF